MSNKARKILCLTCAFVLILGVCASASAAEVDGYHIYTFYQYQQGNTSFTSFNNTISINQDADPLIIKLNVALPTPASANTFFDISVDLYTSGCAFFRPGQVELLDSSWNVLASSEFTISGDQISAKSLSASGECKYISFIFSVVDPTYYRSNGISYDWDCYATSVSFDQVNETDFLSQLVNGIANLPSLILDGIKGLFVPTEQQILDMKDKWLALCEERFGAVYQAASIISEYSSEMQAQAAVGVLDFPEYEFDLKICKWKFGGWQVDLVPDGFELVIEVLKVIVNIVCTLLFVNGLRNRFESVLGGHKE